MKRILCLAGLAAVVLLLIGLLRPPAPSHDIALCQTGDATACGAIIRSRASTADDVYDAYIRRGRTEQKQQSYSQAIADFSAAITLRPDDSKNYVRRGWAYAAARQFDLAQADADKAISLCQCDANGYDLRARLELHALRYNAAIVDAAQAIQLAPDSPVSYGTRGYALAATYNYPTALADFNKFIALAPAVEAAYLNRGQLYEVTRNYPAALADYSKALSLQPNDALAHVVRAITYKDMGQLPAGLADLAKAIAIQPKDPVNLAGLCYGQAVFGDFAGARASCDAAQAAADAPDARLRLRLAVTQGFLALQTKDDAAAIAAYDIALRTEPARAGALYGRGLAEGGGGAADIAAAKKLDPEVAAQFGK